MIPDSNIPDLVPLSRFAGVLSHGRLVREIVGDTYAVLIVQLDLPHTFDAETVAHCDAVVADRLRAAMPSDGLITRLRTGTYGILAFGIQHEDLALGFAASLHQGIRESLPFGHDELRISASIGVAFARPALRPSRAIHAAEIAATRVRLNGGDATFVSHSALSGGYQLALARRRRRSGEHTH
jgi:GGDEF domain-containing protein